MKKHALLFALLSAVAAGAAHADTPKNPISVHVLNTQNGQPAEGVEVILERLENGHWKQIADQRTVASGRISALYPSDRSLKKGIYRARFETGDWYKKHDGKTFFPEIPIQFQITDPSQHYHIPLLLSPYGYTTYRGS